MHQIFALPTLHKVPFIALARQTFSILLDRLDKFPNKLLVFYFPKMVQHQAVHMSISMRCKIVHSFNHESFFSLPVTNVAVASLRPLELACSAVSATVAPFVYFLAITMYARTALRTILDRIAGLSCFLSNTN